ALTLSGHTHWGQFALPMLGWSLASPFLAHAMGAHTSDDAVLYISPGTGYWGIPFRIGARPEVTLVTLRRATTAAAAVHRARSYRFVSGARVNKASHPASTASIDSVATAAPSRRLVSLRWFFS